MGNSSNGRCITFLNINKFSPRVAAARQPWADLCNRFAVRTTTIVDLCVTTRGVAQGLANRRPFGAVRQFRDVERNRNKLPRLETQRFAQPTRYLRPKRNRAERSFNSQAVAKTPRLSIQRNERRLKSHPDGPIVALVDSQQGPMRLAAGRPGPRLDG